MTELSPIRHELNEAIRERDDARADSRYLRRELDAMTGCVAQLSAQLCRSDGAESRPGKRRREEEPERPRSRNARLDRMYSDDERDGWDTCRDAEPWRRDRPEGDGGAGFAA